jgi:hypothetical protein
MPFVPDDVLTKASLGLKNYKIQDLAEEDKKTKSINDDLRVQTLIAASFLIFISFCYMVFIIYKSDKGTFNGAVVGKLLGKNLVIIFFIAVIQFIFLHGVVKKYTLVDTNTVKKTFLTSFKNVKPPDNTAPAAKA